MLSSVLCTVGSQTKHLASHKNSEVFVWKECEEEETIRSLEEESFYNSKRIQECVERVTEAGEDHVVIGVNPVEGWEEEQLNQLDGLEKAEGPEAARSGGGWRTTD